MAIQNSIYMKKIVSLFVALMLLASYAFAQTSVQLSEPVGKRQVKFTQVYKNISKSVKDGETAIDLAAAQYYGQDYLDVTGNQVEVDMFFLSDGLYVGNDGYIHGTGDYITVYFITSAVDANYFPAAGTYTVGESYDPMTIVSGVDVYAAQGKPGYAFDGTIIQSIRHDSLITTQVVTAGSAIIAGNAGNATITLNFTTPTANYIYNGPAVVDNNERDWYKFEPDETTTLNFTKGASVEEVDDNLWHLVVDGDNGFVAHFVLFGTENGANGTFAAGANADDQTAGTFMYSKGCDDKNIFYSCAYVTDEDGYISADDGIYFFTDGSITVADNEGSISVTGNVTSYKGSSMVFNYSGEAAVENVEADFNIYTDGLTLHVEAEEYVVLNAAGQFVYSGNASEITLPAAGVYFVNADKFVKAVVVK